jgi:hypothetical protein
MVESSLSGQAIGAAGELLVQYQLLKRGIDSARLTTDSGIDLAMYVPGTREAHTIQVKTIVKPFPDGGTGPLIVGWELPRTCRAQWLAGVDLSRDMVWLLQIEDALHHARGNTTKVFLYWRLVPPRGPIDRIGADFEQFRFDAVLDRLLECSPVELLVIDDEVE